jgi:hypothetical protein
LSNILPLVLVIISASTLAGILIRRIVRPARPTIDLKERHDHSLDEPSADGKVSLSAIEDRIIFGSVRDAVETSLRNGSPLDTEKIPVERAADWIGALGALVLFGLAIAQALQDEWHVWGKPVFYVSSDRFVCFTS